VENVNWDDLDHQLVHALTVAPRAPFKQIADVLGVSDQTIARRFRKLTVTASLGVRGMVNGQRAGWAEWILRLQVIPGSVEVIADALARRSDTRWVRLVSGGTEILCTLQARTPQQRDDLLLRGLPGSRRVTAITAHSQLHVFTGVEWGGVAAMTDEQVRELRPPQPAPSAGTREREAVQLRPEDDALLAELARDGRAPNSAVAAAVHWHESTVRRRIEELASAGLLYFDVDIDNAFIGEHVTAMFWITAEPAQLDSAGRAVARHPEVPWAAATTGPTNLAVSAVCRDTRHLYEYMTTRLPGVPGVRSVETALVIGTAKRSSPSGVTGGRGPGIAAASVPLA
jgi:DNA-binding Lrp family transcriptional regulator